MNHLYEDSRYNPPLKQYVYILRTFTYVCYIAQYKKFVEKV